MAQTPTFRVVVTSRTTPSGQLSTSQRVYEGGFRGHGSDAISANGEAEVNSKRGAIEIEAEFGNLQKPTTFGNEYLTYILWAISPEGRAVNLGEVLVGGNDRSKLHVTTDLQAFALIVTAEPYYAVRQPSNVVVLENVIRKDTKGTIETVDAKYELMERGGYIPTGYKFDPVVLNAKLPLEFFEARNAVRIAQSEGAEQYASEQLSESRSVDEQRGRICHQKDMSEKAADRSRPRDGSNRGRCSRHRGQEDGRRTSSQRTPGFDGRAGPSRKPKPTMRPGRRNKLKRHS